MNLAVMKEFKVQSSFPVKKKASSPRSPLVLLKQGAQQLKGAAVKKGQSPTTVRRRKNQTVDFDNLMKNQK